MRSFTPMLTSKKKLIFFAIDVFLFFMAFTLILKLKIETIAAGESAIDQLVILGTVAILGQYIFGNYELDYVVHQKQFLTRQLASAVFTLFISLTSNYLLASYTQYDFNRNLLLIVFTVFSMYVLIYKYLVVQMFKTLRTKVKWLVIAPADVQQIIRKDFSSLSFEGQIEYVEPDFDAVAMLMLLKRPWTTIVTSLDPSKQVSELHLMLEAKKDLGVNVITATEFYERHLLKVPIHILDSNWFVDSNGFYIATSPNADRLKRTTDFILASILAIIAAPLMILTYILVKLDSKGPAFYSQIRTGKDNQLFRIYKFRSMRVDAEKNGAQWAMANDTRITRIGSFIRKTRLDELPQIWNILKGDMSFVGPRPERPEFNQHLEAQVPYYQMRHIMTPGLTGWAQVMYPYGASVEDSTEKLQYELYYMKHRSFFQDMSIMLKTVAVVVGAHGR